METRPLGANFRATVTWRSASRRKQRAWERLSSTGFQRTSAAFFTWLGVEPHLTRDAIDDTLGYIGSISNSEVVDYAEPPETFTGDVRGYAAARMAQLEKINEQRVSRIEPAGVARDPSLARFRRRGRHQCSAGCVQVC